MGLKQDRAVIVVDMQKDFMPGGPLPVPAGDTIFEEIKGFAWDERVRVIITTQDWHPYETPHFDTWPEHCVRGSEGASLVPEIEELDPDFRILKGLDKEDGYSGFDGIAGSFALEQILRDEEVEEVVVCGVALDCCVKETAIDAAKRGYRTIVPIGATAGVATKTSLAAVGEMIEAGVEVYW